MVQLDSHLGEFCLSGNEVDGYDLAAGDQPVRDCSLYGHPMQELPSIGARQSIAFAKEWNRIAALNNRVEVTLLPAEQ